MAYDVNALSRVKHLRELAQRVAEGYATKKSVSDLKDQVDGLVTAGGEPNKLEAVKVNGTALPITDKAVDVGTSIAAAVAAADHLTRKKVASKDAIDPAAEGADKFIYRKGGEADVEKEAVKSCPHRDLHGGDGSFTYHKSVLTARWHEQSA